jgi:hypothetical protein
VSKVLDESRPVVVDGPRRVVVTRVRPGVVVRDEQVCPEHVIVTVVETSVAGAAWTAGRLVTQFPPVDGFRVKVVAP